MTNVGIKKKKNGTNLSDGSGCDTVREQLDIQSITFQNKGTYFLYCTWGLDVIKGRRSVCTRPSQHQIVG